MAQPGEEVGSVLAEVSVVEQRYDAVKEVLADGLSISEVAEIRVEIAATSSRSSAYRFLDHRMDRCPRAEPDEGAEMFPRALVRMEARYPLRP